MKLVLVLCLIVLASTARIPLKLGLTFVSDSGIADRVKQAANVAANVINNDASFQVTVSIDSTVGFYAKAVNNESTQRAKFNALAADTSIHAVVGPASSNKAKLASQVIRQADPNMPIVDFAATSETLSDPTNYPNFFRVVPNDLTQARALVDAMYNNGIRKIGFVWVELDDYSIKFKEQLKIRWTEKTGTSFSPATAPSMTSGDVVSARTAINTLYQDGDAAVNICVAHKSDCVLLMKEAMNKGMVGAGWVWIGPDGFTSISGTSSDTLILQNAMQGAVGTSMKHAVSGNSLFDVHRAKYLELYPSTYPWFDNPSIVDFKSYSAQVIDAVRVLAMAATNYKTANPSAVAISRQQLMTALKASTLSVPGLGCVDSSYNFKFDRSNGNAYDGTPAFEIKNYVANAWVDVGDWSLNGQVSQYQKVAAINWPGSSNSVPSTRGALDVDVNVVKRFTLKLGALVPFLPRVGAGLAQFGAPIKTAMKVAEAMINDDPHYKVFVNVDVQDSGSTVDELNVSVDLLKDKEETKAVIGAVRSSYSKPAALRLKPSGVPIISYASTSTELSQAAYTNFFRVVPNDDLQAAALVDVLKAFNIGKVGMIYTTDIYAAKIAEKFKELWTNSVCNGVACVLSPPWESTPKFGLNADYATVKQGVEQLHDLGTAAFNLFMGIDNDAGAVIKAAKEYGMLGDGWNWLGPDGFTSVAFTGDNAALESSFQGATGTAVKIPFADNPLFGKFKAKWEELYPGQAPWHGKTSVALPQFTAQVYDAIAMAAQAATNFIDARPDPSTVVGISRSDLMRELKKDTLKIVGLGNTDGDGFTKFVTYSGNPGDSFDGVPSYEVVNKNGDIWRDVGDWNQVQKFTVHQAPVWAGGQTTPSQTRGTPNDAIYKKFTLKLAALLPYLPRVGAALANMGKQWKDAFAVSAALINANTAYKVNVEVDIVDSGNEISELNTAVDEIISRTGVNKVNAVLGAWRSTRSIATAKKLTPAQIPQISYGSTSPDLSAPEYTSFFRVTPSDANQGNALADFLYGQGVRNVGLIFTDDAYAKKMAEAFVAAWGRKSGTAMKPAGGIEFVMGSGQAKAKEAVTKLLDLGDAAVNVFCGVGDDGVQVMRAAVDFGMIGEGWAWVGADGITSLSLTDKLRDLATPMNGFAGTAVKFAMAGNPLFDPFKEKWEEMFPNTYPWKVQSSAEFPQFAAQIYDSVAIVAAAATAYINRVSSTAIPKSISRADLVAELKKVSLKTPGLGNVDGSILSSLIRRMVLMLLMVFQLMKLSTELWTRGEILVTGQSVPDTQDIMMFSGLQLNLPLQHNEEKQH